MANINLPVNSIYRRFFLASVIWIIFWPILWYIKIGEITGPKAWFWIIGELNYPVVAVAFVLLDSMLQTLVARPWMVFLGSITLIAIAMPFYYERFGFALGVTLQTRYL